MDQTQKKEADNERLIAIGEKPDKLKTIVQCPCSLKADAFYLHMQVVAPSPKPNNLALVISIYVAAFIVKIGIGGAHFSGCAKCNSIQQHNKANSKAGAAALLQICSNEP